MDQATHNKIVSFIWGIADDVLRDLFRRGKYPDVILPMCVLRRLDAVLEPTKKAVLETRKMLDDAGITEQTAALCSASGQAFYNTSKFTLRDLKSRGNQQQLLADFEDYLNGFSPNVQDILENFRFRNQLQTLSKSDSLGTLISKFLDPEIDLTPNGIDNHSMGTVFEELVRKFNEENNEEAGEHWTPRDAVRLMTNLVFRPISKQLLSGAYLLYDDACGTGGILTEGEESAPPVIAKIHKSGKGGKSAATQPDPLHGLYEAVIDGKKSVVEYETDSDLRDSEQIPLLEEGGIEAFIRREVLPYTPDAWVKKDATKIGYEVSFTRHFYQPPQLRTLAQISSDILALEQETEGLLSEITKGATA